MTHYTTVPRVRAGLHWSVVPKKLAFIPPKLLVFPHSREGYKSFQATVDQYCAAILCALWSSFDQWGWRWTSMCTCQYVPGGHLTGLFPGSIQPQMICHLTGSWAAWDNLSGFVRGKQTKYSGSIKDWNHPIERCVLCYWHRRYFVKQSGLSSILQCTIRKIPIIDIGLI